MCVRTCVCVCVYVCVCECVCDYLMACVLCVVCVRVCVCVCVAPILGDDGSRGGGSAHCAGRRRMLCSFAPAAPAARDSDT